ncbi:MAG: inorganic pyrophosphatase [Pseudomonadales bacterium]|nr:inorganic pyrophosphatase [Pseudomonadales bacterium]
MWLNDMDDLSQYTQYLGQDLYVKIDRPKGSNHPRLDFIYETNYGFLPGTKAGDGHEIDVWVLEQETPLSEFNGTCVAVIVRKDDDENKLVVANRRLSKERILEETKFVEGYYDTEVILLPETD